MNIWWLLGQTQKRSDINKKQTLSYRIVNPIDCANYCHLELRDWHILTEISRGVKFLFLIMPIVDFSCGEKKCCAFRFRKKKCGSATDWCCSLRNLLGHAVDWLCCKLASARKCWSHFSQFSQGVVVLTSRVTIFFLILVHSVDVFCCKSVAEITLIAFFIFVNNLFFFFIFGKPCIVPVKLCYKLIGEHDEAFTKEHPI